MEFTFNIIPKCTFDFSNQQKKIFPAFIYKPIVISAACQTLLAEGFDDPCEISVTFTDNEKIREINKEFRDIDKPTDVLSFPMYDFASGEEIPYEDRVTLGDLVISLEQAFQQSQKYGHTMIREVAFLTVHSVLHLLGYDHEKSEEDEKRMFARQKEIMHQLFIGW